MVQPKLSALARPVRQRHRSTAITNMLMEPLLYGESIGVSEVALLIMVAFWTWLWGPIGLVLSAPLTVCLMVISRSVVDLEFIGLLLSSEPALDPHHMYYQRLVAKDGDGAHEIVASHLKEHSRAELFEQLLIPTLVSCRRDCELDRHELIIPRVLRTDL